MSAVQLPEDIRYWFEDNVSGTICRIERPQAGASRDAWSIDIKLGKKMVPLFLLQDKSGVGGSAKDAAVLDALRSTEIPVPKVIAQDEKLGVILLERVDGSSRFTEIEDFLQKEKIAEDLMHIAARLHEIKPDRMVISHLSVPKSTDECITQHITALKNALPAFDGMIEPFYIFAIDWLDRNRPQKEGRISLIHSDLGPENFLFHNDKITAILDWEVAHFGDPMEDLATIAIRDMATPVGDLTKRYEEYSKYSGSNVDLSVVAYYRILILIRNSLFIGLGIKYPSPGFNILEMLGYQALLMRAAALCISDFVGEKNTVSLDPSLNENIELLPEVTSGIKINISDICRSSVETDYQSMQYKLVLSALDNINHYMATKSSLDDLELDAIKRIFDKKITSISDGHAEIRGVLKEGGLTKKTELSFVKYFCLRACRIAESRRYLMGELFYRMPQSLLTN